MLSQRTFSHLIVALVVFVGRGVKAQDVDSKVRVVTNGPFAGLACGFADGDAGTALQVIHKDKWSGTVSHFDISVCPKPIRAKVDPAIRSLISYPLVVSDQKHFNDVWRTLQCKGKPPKLDFDDYLAIVRFRDACDRNEFLYAFVLSDDHTLRMGYWQSLLYCGQSEQIAYSWFLVQRKMVRQYEWKHYYKGHTSIENLTP